MSNSRAPEAAARPVVACYCATFLKLEMLHIYRQLTALERVRSVVIARKRENAARFPFAPLHLVERPALHFLRRFWFKNVRRAPWPISPNECARIRQVLDHSQAQLLHIYFGHIAVHLQPLIDSWTRPCVVSFHGADVQVDMAKPGYRAATERMLKSVRLVLVRSRSLRDAVLRLGCPEGKIRIHRTGIPLGEFPFRARAWPTNGAWHFVQASRLIEKKGFATSLRAFAQFATRFPQSHFTLAGEGPLRESLQSLAQKLGVAGKISFPGFLDQSGLRELYYRSHIFLHPSEMGTDGNQEGVPNAMLEAMATGLPVFATAHGGIPEAVENGASGVLVPERDADGLAARLLEYAEAPERLASLAGRGAQSIAENFDQAKNARKLEEFYLEAIASGRVKPG